MSDKKIEVGLDLDSQSGKQALAALEAAFVRLNNQLEILQRGFRAIGTPVLNAQAINKAEKNAADLAKAFSASFEKTLASKPISALQQMVEGATSPAQLKQLADVLRRRYDAVVAEAISGRGRTAVTLSSGLEIKASIAQKEELQRTLSLQEHLNKKLEQRLVMQRAELGFQREIRKSETEREATLKRTSALETETVAAARKKLELERQLGLARADLMRATAATRRDEALFAVGAPNTLDQSRVNLGQAQARFNAINDEAQILQQHAHRLKSVLSDGGAYLFRIQAELLKNYVLMNQIFNLVSFGTQYVIQLDQAMHQLQAISASTNTEMVAMKANLEEVARGTRFTAAELAEASVVMAQAGFSTQEIRGSIEAVAKFATATGTDLAKSVDTVTSVMSIFNLQASQTGFVTNVLTGALNRSKLDVEKLAYGLQYAGNTAADVGVEFTELTAVLAAFANSGVRSGSTLGTGLRQLIVDLTKPTDALVQELSRVGLTLGDVDIRSRGLINVLTSMRDAGFTAANAFKGMEVRAAAAYSAIINQSEGLHQLEQQILLSNAAQEANDIQMNSIANTISRFTAALGTLIDRLTTGLQAAFVLVTNVATSFMNVLTQIPGLLEGLGIIATSAAIGMLSRTISLMVTNLIAMIGPVTTATGAFAALRTVLGGWVGVVMAALSVVAMFGSEIWKLINPHAALKEELDQATASLNEFQARYKSTSDSISQVDEVLVGLYNRYRDLKDGGEALNTVVLETESKLGSLGLELPPVVGGFNDLVTAVANLRGELVQLNATDLSLVISQLTAVINLKAAEAAENARTKISDIVFDDNWNSSSIGMMIPGAAEYAKILSGDRKTLASEVMSNMTQIENLYAGGFPEAAKTLEAKTKTLIKELTKDLGLERRGLAPGDSRGAELDKVISDFVSIAKSLDATASLNLQRAEAEKQQAYNELRQSEKGQAVTQYIDAWRNKTLSENSLERGRPKWMQPATLEGRAASASITKEKMESALRALEEYKQFIPADILEAVKPQITDAENAVRAQIATVAETAKQAEKRLKEKNDLDKEVARSGLDLVKEDLRSQKLSAAKRQELLAKGDSYIDTFYKQELQDLNQRIANETSPDMKESLKDRYKAIEDSREREKKSLRRLDERMGGTGGRRERPSFDYDQGLWVGGVSGWKDRQSEAERAYNAAIRSASADYNAARTVVGIAEQTPGYNKSDLDYAKRVTLKEKEIAMLGQQIEAEKRYIAAIEEGTPALKKHLQAEIERAKQIARSGPTEKVRTEAMREEARLRQELETVINAEADAAQRLFEKMIRFEALRGRLVLPSQTFGSRARQAISGYLEENSGSSSLEDLLKDDLPSIINNAGSAFRNFFKESITGAKSLGEAFQNMALSIVDSLMDIASQWAANQIFSAILSLFMPSGGITPTSIGSNIGGSLLRTGMAGGGLVQPGAAGGRLVKGNVARDSVLTPTMPGEFILRKSAVDMIGVDALEDLNARGNRISSRNMPRLELPKPDPVINNIYVIPQEQARGMSKRDVVVNLQEALATDGTTRKLVKTITSQGV